MNLHHELFLMRFGLDRAPVQPPQSVATIAHASGPEAAPKRPHILPRRFWRYEVPGSLFEKLSRLSPRQQYIADQSVARWERRHNAGEKLQLHRGELGTIQGIAVITAGGTHAPVAPPRFTDSPDFGVIIVDARKP